MPVVSLFPVANGGSNAWTLGAGSGKPAACQTNDGDTSYIVNGTVGNGQTFTLDPLDSAATSINGEVAGHALGRNEGGGRTLIIRLRLSATNSDSSAFATTGSYVDYSQSPGRPGGGAWSPADIATLESGVVVGGTGTGNVRATQIYAVVDYNIDAGGFAYLCSSLIGPLVAVGLLELPRLVAALYRADRRWRRVIRPDEYAQLWRALREDRRRRYFFAAPLTPAAGGVA